MKLVKLDSEKFFKRWSSKSINAKMFCLDYEDTFSCSKCCFKIMCGRVLKQI